MNRYVYHFFIYSLEIRLCLVDRYLFLNLLINCVGYTFSFSIVGIHKSMGTKRPKFAKIISMILLSFLRFFVLTRMLIILIKHIRRTVG